MHEGNQVAVASLGKSDVASNALCISLVGCHFVAQKGYRSAGFQLGVQIWFQLLQSGLQLFPKKDL